MGKPKQFPRPPKKQKSKTVAPETAEEFQEAADREEETGGKWRAGDTAKSGRAFVRALEIYDKGLLSYPSNFDLAYNKARLQLEITQQPVLVEPIGLPLVDLLQQTLESHRYALRLNEDDQSLLFNTSQVLTSLAEQLSECGHIAQAISSLQESLELLSACLSRQEMLLEQQRMDFDDIGEGGVAIDPDEKPASTPGSDLSERTALIEIPLTPNDLLDTVHASLSALTTIVSIVEQSAFQMYGDMAHALTDKKAPSYLQLLPADLQPQAIFTVALDRAIFIATLADVQYGFYQIDLDTYLSRLEAFNVLDKEPSAHALTAEAEARTEFTFSMIDHFEDSPDLPAEVCWKQLGLAQDLYTKAAKLDAEDAKERKAHVYESKGNLELLRHRMATAPGSTLSQTIQRSAKTLIQNAQTFYKGAAQLSSADGETEIMVKEQQRWLIATNIGAVLYGMEQKEPHFNPGTARGDIIQELEKCVDEGLIDMFLGQEIMKRMRH